MLPFDEAPRDRLPSDAGSVLPFTVWPFAAVFSAVADEGEEGDRRCLLKYEVDETDRGREGRRDPLWESGFAST
jgi:hypothetical protein